jgi:aminoglycoside 6'-N-acetyltransferase
VPCYKCVMELRGDRVTLRPLADEDVPRLVELGTDPEVARWWAGIDEAHIQEKVLDGLTFAIVADGELAGMIQYHEEEDPEYRHAGMDLFLGTPFQDRGLGTDTVRTMARYLVDERGHHRLTIDPAAANERAIRCYEKIGFRRIGVMREYWLDPEGVWRDGMLLDLLARELR